MIMPPKQSRTGRSPSCPISKDQPSSSLAFLVRPAAIQSASVAVTGIVGDTHFATVFVTDASLSMARNLSFAYCKELGEKNNAKEK